MGNVRCRHRRPVYFILSHHFQPQVSPHLNCWACRWGSNSSSSGVLDQLSHPHLHICTALHSSVSLSLSLSLLCCLDRLNFRPAVTSTFNNRCLARTRHSTHTYPSRYMPSFSGGEFGFCSHHARPPSSFPPSPSLPSFLPSFPKLLSLRLDFHLVHHHHLLPLSTTSTLLGS